MCPLDYYVTFQGLFPRTRAPPPPSPARGGDPAFWEEPASWEGTCILGGNYFFKIDYLAIKSDIYLFKTNSCCDKYLVLLKDYNHSVITCCEKE